MTVSHRAFNSFLFFSCWLAGVAAFAEVEEMSHEKLEAFATHIVDGKLVRIYTSVEKVTDWEMTYSVAEVQVDRVVKGKHSGKLAYARFWHRKWIGKGDAPDGAYGNRDVPEIGSAVRVYARDGDDGGLNAVLPNGITHIPSPLPRE